MPIHEYPEAFHEYVETIFRLARKAPDNLVTNLDIAQDLKIKPPSVTEMIAKLQESGLVEWEKRKGVRLTPNGVTLASRVIRNHVVLKVLFNKVFGVEDDAVLEQLACDIEHHLSGKVTMLMERVLGTGSIDIESLATDDIDSLNKMKELRDDLQVVNTSKVRNALDAITNEVQALSPPQGDKLSKLLKDLADLFPQ